MLTFAPDLFTPSLTHVWQDSQRLGTIAEQEAGRYTATFNGTARTFPTRLAAVAYLTTGKATSPAQTEKTASQLTLF